MLFIYKTIDLVKDSASKDALNALEAIGLFLDNKISKKDAHDIFRVWIIKEGTDDAYKGWTHGIAGSGALWAVKYATQVDPTTIDTIWLYYRELADPVGTLVEAFNLKC